MTLTDHFPELGALSEKPLRLQISIIKSRMQRERDIEHRCYLADMLRALKRAA